MEKVGMLETDAMGSPMPGVEIFVKLAGTATPGTPFSDNGITGKGSGGKFLNDANGSWECYLPTGRYDFARSKPGGTFDQSDTSDVFVFDPLEADEYYAALMTDFMTAFLSGTSLVFDGGVHLVRGTAPLVLKAPTTTYKNGWKDVLGDGTNAPKYFQANQAGAIVRPFTITADPLIYEMRLERVTATASTIRVGLADADMSAGAPANGVYIEQIDAANAFLKVRSGAAESGSIDLGVTTAAMKRIRIAMTSTSVRAFVDAVAKTPVTASIPTGQMFGVTGHSSAVGSGVGFSLDYLRVWAKR